MQGLALHVNENSEKLRHMFVNHQGRKNLKVIRDELDLYKMDWDNITREFSQLIKENVGNDCFNLCVPKFSTTKPEYSTAFEINIMGTTQKYFKFKLGGGCGIPKIHLLGTQQDWDELRARANTLRQYELEDWINHLLPVLDKIIHLFKTGEVDLVFWNDIYHYRDGGGSGPPAAAFGWITLFFPYTRKEQNSNIPDTNKMFDFKKSQLHPYGVTDAPVEFTNFITGEKTQLTFRSGFFGISRVNGFLKPAVGWLIMAAADQRSIEEKEGKPKTMGKPEFKQKQEIRPAAKPVPQPVAKPAAKPAPKPAPKVAKKKK